MQNSSEISFYLTFKCDLDLQPNQTNVSYGTTTPQGEHSF